MDTAIEQFYQPVIRQTCIGLEKHEDTSPSGGNKCFLPCECSLGKTSASFSANSLSGSCVWMRPSSLSLKLSKYFCWKSNSVNGNDGCFSDIFCRLRGLLFFKFYPRINPWWAHRGSIVKLQNNIYIENQLVIYSLNSPNYISTRFTFYH